jgi:hypothetical protein
MLTKGYRSPISDFASRGRKRGMSLGGAGARAAPGDTGGAMGRRLATEVRGQLRVAVIRKNVRHHARVRLLLPCSHSTPLDLHLGLFPRRRFRFWAWAVGAEGRWFPMAVRRWRWRQGGSRWTQGRDDDRVSRVGGSPRSRNK